MSLLWMDGFDHYGGVLANITDGAWADDGSLGSLQPLPRTGTYAYRFSGGGISNYAGIRRVLGGDYETVGVGLALYMSTLPNANGEHRVINFKDVGNNVEAILYVNSTGALYVTYAGGTYTTPTPEVVAQAYQHIEMKIFKDSANGYLEVRVNGVTVINLSDINTGDDLVSQVEIGGSTNGGNAAFYFDDVFAWNGEGSINNDFLGDRRVRTIFPDEDTSSNEWSVTGAASGFDAINEADPDDDTSYIEADLNVPVTSEFKFESLPAGIGGIAGIQTYVRQKKTDAGDGSTQTTVISNAAESAGENRPITTAYTYWMDMFELDPDTGSAWTKESVDDITVRLRRTL